MMNEAGVARPRKKPFLPRWLKFLLMLLGFLFLVSALLWVIADISTHDALEAELAKLRARGWPTEVADLYPDPIPPEENAALTYRQAFAAPQISTDEWKPFWKFMGVISVGQPNVLTDEERAQVEACVERNAAALELLHQAAQMPHCHFGFVPDRPWPSVDAGDHCALLIPLANCALRLSLEKARGDDALRYWQDVVSVSRALEHHRVILSELARIDSAAMSLHALQSLLQSDLLDEEQLGQALQTLAGLEGRESFASGIRGELVKDLEMYHGGFVPSYDGSVRRRAHGEQVTWKDRLGDLGNWLYGSQLYGTWLFRPVRHYDEVRFVRLVGSVGPLCEEPYYRTQAERRRLEQEADGVPPWLPLSRLKGPNFVRLLGAQANHEARVANARTAIALEIYRKRHGGYPDELAALVPGILPRMPLDPFDGKPLRYVNSPDRVVVYSVAWNLKDDAGSVGPGTPPYPRDIVFTLRRAPEPTEESDDE